MKRFKQVNQQVFYDMDQDEKNGYMDYIERKIKREKSTKPVFYEMYEIMKSILEHYHSDFYVHDYNRLTKENYSCQKFLWIVHKSGSHMVKLDNDFIEERNSEYNYFHAIKDTREKGSKTYIIDLENEKVKPVNMDRINEKYFTFKHGDIYEYFNKNISDADLDASIKARKKFIELMEQQRNFCTRKQLDEIIKAYKKDAVLS